MKKSLKNYFVTAQNGKKHCELLTNWQVFELYLLNFRDKSNKYLTNFFNVHKDSSTNPCFGQRFDFGRMTIKVKVCIKGKRV